MITARGMGLTVAGAGALSAGFAFGYPELGLLGTTGLVAAVFALGYASWRPTLRVDRVAEPDRVARGESCTVTLTVGNGSRLRAVTLLAEDHCGARTVPVPLLRLRPRRDTEVRYPVPTDRRGVLPIGPLRVTRRDPLGLASLHRGHGGTATVWVYPRVLPLSAVPPGVARSLDGRIDRVPHGSITFDTLREYVIGDELRRVHWRTSARMGELMVREHLDTSLPRIVVLLDDRAVAYPDAARGFAETFESACEAAASVVAAAVREELPVALHLVAAVIGASSPGVAATAGGSGEGPANPVTSGGPLASVLARWPLATALVRRARAGAGRGGWRREEPASSHHGGGSGAAVSACVDSGGRRAESARPFLDLLAEASLVAGSSAGGGAAATGAGKDGAPAAETVLRMAVDRLRHRPAGDTVVFLTGAGGRAGLGEIAALRGRYPSVLAAVFDNNLDGAGGGSPRSDGLVVLAARDGEEFAAEWEGARGW